MSLFKPKFVTVEIDGQPINFYSLSFPVLFQLKSAVGPISKVVMGLFGRGKQDIARYQEDTKRDGVPVRIVQELAISPEMAKMRADLSAKQLQEALNDIFADQNRLLIGRVLMDSMRDNCPRKPDVKQIEEFLADLDLGQLVALLQGVAKANADVLGPLVRGWLKQAAALLRDQGLSVSPRSDGSSKPSESSAQDEQGELRLVPKE